GKDDQHPNRLRQSSVVGGVRLHAVLLSVQQREERRVWGAAGPGMNKHTHRSPWGVAVCRIKMFQNLTDKTGQWSKNKASVAQTELSLRFD
ncbi:hypothetical protein Bpfe_016465, partial [Biomphalaria pfeifferi]